jgi:hypothetical protein
MKNSSVQPPRHFAPRPRTGHAKRRSCGLRLHGRYYKSQIAASCGAWFSSLRNGVVPHLRVPITLLVTAVAGYRL